MFIYIYILFLLINIWTTTNRVLNKKKRRKKKRKEKQKTVSLQSAWNSKMFYVHCVLVILYYLKTKAKHHAVGTVP